MKKALIILANGFEEIEATAIIDILRRGQVQVTVAGLNQTLIIGAHQINIQADTTVEEIKNNEFDAVILPGGEPGTTNLQKDKEVAKILLNHAQNEKIVAAICAAPKILDQLGLLQNKNATSYPGNKGDMIRCNYKEDRVVKDGNILTSRGPGTSMEFAYALLEELGKEKEAAALKQGMLAQA